MYNLPFPRFLQFSICVVFTNQPDLLHWILFRLEKTRHLMKSSIFRSSGSVYFLPCLAQDAFGRVFQTRPHQEEITKVDDKHGAENILPKAEICIKKFLVSTVQVKPLDKSPISLTEKLELSHKMAPLMIYRRQMKKKRTRVLRERPNSAQKFCPNRHSQDDTV